MLTRDFIFQSLCLILMCYNVILDNASLDDCELMSGCPDDPNDMYFERDIPRCYCDTKCEMYHDCCKGFHDNVTDMEYQNPGETSTCLTIDDDRAGFWIVNRCGRDGPVCTDNKTLSNVLRHLPVTDSYGVHYFGAECAICNKVSNFTKWGVFVAKNRATSKATMTTSLGKVDEGMMKNTWMKNATSIPWRTTLEKINNAQTTNITDLPKIFQNLGLPRLAAPSGVRLRVCYRFGTPGARNELNCPLYQNPVYVDNDLFRNIDCCGMGTPGTLNCSSRNIMCTRHGFSFIRRIDVKKSDVLKSNELQKLGVLFSFEDEKQTCVSSKSSCNGRCQDKAIECSKREVKIWGYPLRQGRYLTLIWYNAYDDGTKFMSDRAIFTFFLKSKWKMRLGSWITFKMNIGSDCDGGHEFCNIIKYPLTPISLETLSTEDITLLESWTENLQFTITMNFGKSLKMFGSFSSEINEELNCSCKQNIYYEPLQANYEYPLIGFTWSSEYNGCTDFNFNMSLNKLDVRCQRGPSKGRADIDSRNSGISSGIHVTFLPVLWLFNCMT